MKIIEKDFKIEYDGFNFVLYFLKTKKELKSAPKAEKEEFFKFQGYYSRIENAILAAYKWRIDKKYPHSEPTSEFRQRLIEYRKNLNLVKESSKIIYKSLYDLKEKMLHANK